MAAGDLSLLSGGCFSVNVDALFLMFRKEPDDLQGDFYGSIHAFCCDVLVRTVICMSTGSEIRAGQSHKA